MAAPVTATSLSSWWRLSLGKQIFLGVVLGIGLGWLAPRWAAQASLLRDLFLHLIQLMIAPLIFSSIVQGIAGTGDMKKVGRIGLKSLIYFEALTTLALVVGLGAVNLLQPGAGVTLSGDTGTLGALTQSKPKDLAETILHIFPTSVIDAMARGDVLQIVAFSVLFAFAVMAAGASGKVVLDGCESLRHIMFQFAGLIMKLAPIGVGAAIAVSVGHQGLGILLNLGKLLFTLYAALAFFIVVVFGLVLILAKIPLRPFIRAVGEPFTLAFATANSEAALPLAFQRMERFGVPRSIVGFVLPMGYSFNLDGSTLYLSVAAVFIAQAAETVTHVHFGLTQQILLLLTLMLTSKGVAAVPRASIIILIAALHSFGLPLEGAAMILGVDAFMDMARTSVNVLGNCLASAVIARWENELDMAKAEAEFGAKETG